MIDENEKAFSAFFDIHDKYSACPAVYQDEFTRIGREIQDIIRDYERKLCGHSEKGMYSKFSQNLSEKFWGLVRKDFPKIDFVGVKIS